MTGVPDDLDLARDPELAHAADVLARALVRFHPSFRFEERLAARLRDAAQLRDVAQLPDAAASAAALGVTAPETAVPRADSEITRPRRIIPFPALPVTGGSMPFALDLAPAAVGQAMGRVPRPVLVGGAIASGVSLAGAAVVAWRIVALRHPRRDA